MDATLYTYADAIDHLVDFLGANPGEEAYRTARRAIQSAYREFAAEFRWSYYYQRGRINTVEPYSTGTIAYDHTGGTYERQLTLSSGTWPTWAAFGTVVIDNVPYEVASRVSSTVLTLTAASNPGEDVAASTEYEIYRDTYPMPVDFVAADQLASMNGGITPQHLHPREWLDPQCNNQSPSQPMTYCFTSDPNYLGAMAVRFWPAPDDVYAFDFIYQRRPRPLVIDRYLTGTVSVTASSATVTGSGSAFASKHAGACIRLYSDSSQYPTGWDGLYPPSAERTLASVTSATVATADAVFDASLTSVKYVISDIVDVEAGAMMSAFLRCCEKEVAIIRNMKTVDKQHELYRVALIKAREADNRSFARRMMGEPVRVQRYADMPVTFD